MSAFPSILQPAADENAYFVTANGYRGFRSYYGDVYRSDEFTRIFVLKGGPGTGKSRLMREVAASAAAGGAAVDYVYCSSDPASLDGVIMKKGEKRVAILDGTAPHLRCADVPGAVDELVNLGEFWNPFELVCERDEILRLSREKSAAFSLGYRYLSLAGNAMEAALAVARTALDKEKLDAFLLRRLRKATKTQHKERRIMTDGIGMRGHCHFKTMEKRARTVISVGSRFGFDYLFFDAARELLRHTELDYTLVESPRDRALFDGIYLEADGVLLLSERLLPVDKPHVNPLRFFHPTIIKKAKGDLKYMLFYAEDAERHAIDAFKNAGEAHFALEEIYVKAMDFSKKEALTALLSERISYLLS